MNTRALSLLIGLLIGIAVAPAALAQSGTVFTYQGRLLDTSAPANGTYEFQFRLYNVANGGTALATYVPPAAIAIVQGLVDAPVDFGALFAGADLYLEVGVRAAGAPAYTTLAPRQRITPAPGAMYAQLAAVAGANSVNSLSITDASVISTKLASGAVTADKIADAAVATAKIADNAVTSGKIADGSVGAADINQASVQRRSDQMGTACATANLSIKTIAPDGTVTCEADDAAGTGWGLTGNAGTNPATNYLGTSDNVVLSFRVNNTPALRLLPTVGVPTVIGGSILNTSNGAEGATIAGGGEINGSSGNQALGNYAVVGGGGENVASNDGATVVGGTYNTASGLGATVGGGSHNCAGASISWAGGLYAQVRPGNGSGAPGLGCEDVPVSQSGDTGTFVWADTSTSVPFVSSGPNQFLVRAAGGVGINTSTTSDSSLWVEGNNSVSGTAIFGSPKNNPGPRILSHVHFGDNGDWYIRSAKPQGSVILQDSGGAVAIGTAAANPDSRITALPLTEDGDVLTFSAFGSRLSANQGGSIELGATNDLVPFLGATPFIDFHYSSGVITPPRDYDVRLINSSQGVLTLAGTLAVTVNASKPGGGSWSVLSDARVKHDIREIESPLDRVLSLHGITFEYNADAGPMAVPGRHIGFIAQEVEQVFPDWITEDEQGIKTVNIHGFESLLVEAIRELKARHDVEVDALRAENIALRGRLDRIESLVRQDGAE